MAISEKIRNFLLEDTSGSVSSEWTVLTALLTVATISTVGTFSVGVHAVAHAIEADISTVETMGNGDNGNGELG